MNRLTFFLAVIAYFCGQPAHGAEQEQLKQKAYFTCSVTGNSNKLEEHEKGPVFFFSVAVSGLEKTSSSPVENSIVTEMVIDNHKILNGGNFYKGLTAKEGYVLIADYPNGQSMMIAFIAKNNASEFRLVVTGFEKEQKAQWAFFEGLCRGEFRKDDVIPAYFMDAMYPFIEKSASERYSSLKDEKSKKQ
jgi:hypothetical protein